MSTPEALLKQMQQLEARVKAMQIILGFEKRTTGVTFEEYTKAMRYLDLLALQERPTL